MASREDAISYTAQITQQEIINEANELGVTPQSLADLRIGKNSPAFECSFPLRQPNGYIIGTSNRPLEQNSNRTKRTIGQGASKGLLFIPESISPHYVILTEGASDTAAVISAGFSSVVGRASAASGTESVVQLCQRLRPRLVINLRDADRAGMLGHKKLVRAFGTMPVIELLPANGHKDAREWYRSDPNGMRIAIVEYLQRIDLPESEYAIPSGVTLSDYATSISLSTMALGNHQLGRFQEPVHPDFRLGAIPEYLPSAEAVASTESVPPTEQTQPILDRNRVRFVATIGVVGEQLVSEPVDHTNPAQVDEFIQEWSVQHHLNADHLRSAIPFAVQDCWAWVAAQQRRQPERLDIFSDTPQRVAPETRNIEDVVDFCKLRLRWTGFGTDCYRLVNVKGTWFFYSDGIGYTTMTEKDVDNFLVPLIRPAVKNSSRRFRSEIKAFLEADLKTPNDLKLGQWMPPMSDSTATVPPGQAEYMQRMLNFPANEMLATPAGLIHLPTVDLECPDYIPLSPTWFGAVTTSVSVEPFAQCPGWHRHLDRVFGTDEKGMQNREALKDWFGYCLMPHARLNKFCVLHGASQSGKSTCLRVLMALVRSVTVTAAELGQQFGLQRLEGITHAAIDDMKIDKNWFRSEATSRLLSLAGGMKTTIQRKNATSVDTHPALKFTITANEMPKFDNSHNAVTNRIHPIHFEHAIDLRQRRNGIEQEWIQSELSGILGWAIEGYQRVYEHNILSLPGSLAESLNQLNDETDPISEFVRDSLVQTSPHEFVLLAEIFNAYRGYCEEVNVHPITRRDLKNTLTSRYGLTHAEPRSHHEPRGSRVFGISMSPEGLRYADAFRSRNRRSSLFR